MNTPKKVIIVGGVAGGASCAARLRRLDERAKITVFDRGPFVSFANCGLPYRVGNVIPNEASLLLASPNCFMTASALTCGCITKSPPSTAKRRPSP